MVALRARRLWGQWQLEPLKDNLHIHNHIKCYSRSTSLIYSLKIWRFSINTIKQRAFSTRKVIGWMSTNTSNLNENESKSTVFGPPQFFLIIHYYTYRSVENLHIFNFNKPFMHVGISQIPPD